MASVERIATFGGSKETARETWFSVSFPRSLKTPTKKKTGVSCLVLRGPFPPPPPPPCFKGPPLFGTKKRREYFGFPLGAKDRRLLEGPGGDEVGHQQRGAGRGLQDPRDEFTQAGRRKLHTRPDLLKEGMEKSPTPKEKSPSGFRDLEAPLKVFEILKPPPKGKIAQWFSKKILNPPFKERNNCPVVPMGFWLGFHNFGREFEWGCLPKFQNGRRTTICGTNAMREATFCFTPSKIFSGC